MDPESSYTTEITLGTLIPCAIAVHAVAAASANASSRQAANQNFLMRFLSNPCRAYRPCP